MRRVRNAAKRSWSWSGEPLAMETLGLNLGESKTLLEGVQRCMANEQVTADLRQRRRCPDCCECIIASRLAGRPRSKPCSEWSRIANPRWERCACQESMAPRPSGPPQAGCVVAPARSCCTWKPNGHRILPFAKVAELLCEVLPVDAATNHETIRRHLQATAQKMEQALGEERPSLRSGTCSRKRT